MGQQYWSINNLTQEGADKWVKELTEAFHNTEDYTGSDVLEDFCGFIYQVAEENA